MTIVEPVVLLDQVMAGRCPFCGTAIECSQKETHPAWLTGKPMVVCPMPKCRKAFEVEPLRSSVPPMISMTFARVAACYHKIMRKL